MALVQVLAWQDASASRPSAAPAGRRRWYCLRERFGLLLQALLSLAGLEQLLPLVVVQRRLLLRILKPLRRVLYATLDLRQALHFVRQFLRRLLLPYLVGRVLRLLRRLLQLLRGGLRGRLRRLRAVLAELLSGLALILLRALRAFLCLRRAVQVLLRCAVWFCRSFC